MNAFNCTALTLLQNETLKTKIEDLEKQLAEAEQQRNQAAATAKKLEEDNKTIS